MAVAPVSIHDIECILFDVGGTLRSRIPDPAMQRLTRQKFMALLGQTGDPDEYFDELMPRYKAYTHWARENLVELPEKQIWSHWMLPEFPRDQIEPIAQELMMLWRDRGGRPVLKTDAATTVVELDRRGYRMGVISNTNSSKEIFNYLAETALERYFQVIVLSAISGRRKPDPALFWEATGSMHLEPLKCAYVGNRLAFDIAGSRRAGLGRAVLLESPAGRREDERDLGIQPDAVIHTLCELLDIFPPRAKAIYRRDRDK